MQELHRKHVVLTVYWVSVGVFLMHSAQPIPHTYHMRSLLYINEFIYINSGQENRINDRGDPLR
jgi:hypothetical protein